MKKRFNQDDAIGISVFYCGDKDNWKKYWGKIVSEEFTVHMEDFNKHVHVFLFKSDIESKTETEILDLAYDAINEKYKDEEIINSGTVYALNNELYFCASNGWINITRTLYKK